MTDQVVDTGGASGAGVAGAAPAPAGHGHVTGEDTLLGRERELASLHEDIGRTGLDTLAGHTPPRARVLLVAGRPGSGRTALAETFAAALTERYPDGLLRVRLTDPAGAPVPAGDAARSLLTDLGEQTPAGAADDVLTEQLRAALGTRRVLLLLDDAHDAAQVDELLPDNPACLLLAVATGPLTGLSDVRPCTLGGLERQAAQRLVERYAGPGRAAADPHAAERLVEECRGQPAALVLAGGWLATRPESSFADLLARLEAHRAAVPRALPEPAADEDGGQGTEDLPDAEVPGRSEALEDADGVGGARGVGGAAPARRMTAATDLPVERLLRFSHDQLPAADQRLLRLLHLAPEGLADAHTASALAGCSVRHAAERLEHFVRHGLLRPLPGPRPAYEVPGCLVPGLRALAHETDRPAELQLARARMLERTVRLLHSCRATSEPLGSPARRRLAGLPSSLRFPGPGAAADWLAERLPALLAAARLAVDEGEFDTLARRYVAALVRALVAHRGTEAAAPELYGLHRLVLDVATRRGLHREEAAALLNLADLDARTGRTRDALARYRAALDAARTGRDPHAAGRAMESLAGAHQELGDWARAADWYGRALAHRLVRAEDGEAARLYGKLAAVHAYAGRYGDARRNWGSAIAVHKRRGDVAGQARALAELARVQEYAGRPEEALRTCQEAVALAERAADERLRAALHVRLADTLDRLGDPASARHHRGLAARLLGPGEAAVLRAGG
ncbi:tetratricopeptide repeat protein [Streptomyces sp. CA-253872]|uniref:tetratricopeptide repeat protein n=1 Tax=Streptomyces sp. CA-253872 TaxID=3240067 RepID=UPI003D8BC258